MFNENLILTNIQSDVPLVEDKNIKLAKSIILKNPIATSTK